MSEVKTIGEAIDILLKQCDGQIAQLDEVIARASAQREKSAQMRSAVLEFKKTASDNNWNENAITPTAKVLLSSYPLSSPSKGEPLWKTIERVMRGKDKFTGAEAVDAVERELGRSLGKNRHQTVRNNFIRKPDVFRQNKDSSWTVISNEKEAPITETS
jgi:hypothetical protein